MSLMIDRVFISVLLLSISGFVFCAVFLPFEKFAYRLTSAKTMVTMNTAALFSFVIPFYIIASVFDGSEKMFTTKNLLVFEDTEAFETYTGILRDTYIIENLKYIWLAGVIIFLAYHIFAYVNFLSKLKSDGFYLNAKIWKDCFNRLKDKNNVPRVELIGCCNIFTPCTVGIKSKKIVIPATMIGAFDAEEIEFILMHEFYHVAHNDLPRKLLIIILNSLNWFNPLFYFLRGNLSDWQEAACDDAVTSGFNKRERTKYCRLLIKVPELENEISKGRTFGINFGGNGVENYKRRISRIMNKNSTNSKFGKVIVTSVAMLAMVSGSVVAKALILL
ncbi:methicillin resistance mecR1 protein [Clostridiales bacterium]|nr:methicillin resistance mecR1 protein [Clostridiales bacterium]